MEELNVDFTLEKCVNDLVVLNSKLKVLQDKLEELINSPKIRIESGYNLNKAKESLIVACGKIGLYYNIYQFDTEEMSEFGDVIILDQPYNIIISDIKSLIKDLIDKRNYHFSTIEDNRLESVFAHIEDSFVWIMEEVKLIRGL